MSTEGITYRDADAALLPLIERDLSEMAARHVCMDNGFTLAALYGDRVVGILAIAWLALPPWVPPTREAFVNVIEVAPSHRRRGIGRRLVEMACHRAAAEGVYQIRGWSSSDRTAAHALWRALGFGLCPAAVYPRGQEVNGCYFARVLARAGSPSSEADAIARTQAGEDPTPSGAAEQPAPEEPR